MLCYYNKYIIINVYYNKYIIIKAHNRKRTLPNISLSGVSDHMTSWDDWFTEYKFEAFTIRVDNEAVVPALGRSNIDVCEMKNDTMRDYMMYVRVHYCTCCLNENLFSIKTTMKKVTDMTVINIGKKCTF